MKLNDCGLLGYLEEQGVTHCYCVGLVFDICVKSTALHGAEAGFQMCV
jgi:nicotinamidase-related amidase